MSPDLIGQRFGRLMVKVRHGTNERRESTWSCSCDCGNNVIVAGRCLRRGETVSCGCKHHPSLVGQRYGRLLVESRISNTPLGKTRWCCLCDCGQRTIVPSSDLRSGATQSCGCLWREAKIHKPNVAAFSGSPVSDEAAYWAGFILADGSVRQKNASMDISLHESDATHLRAMAAFICPTTEVNQCFGRPAVRFCVHGRPIVQALRRFGIVPQKSYGHPLPELTESERPHFLRGFFDGDGCVGVYLQKGSARSYPHWKVVGTESWLRNIQEGFALMFGRCGSMHCYGSYWALQYVGSAVPRILRYLAGEPCLHRKWLIAGRITAEPV